MESFGDTIRKLREKKGWTLHMVAESLDINSALLSKIERGLRNARREHVIKLAEIFKIQEQDLLVSWLSEKLVYEVADENLALEALQLAEEKVSYKTDAKIPKADIIHSIKSVLERDGRVSAAWLYGSIARGEDIGQSDIDIIVELNEKKKYSMFDLLDIAYLIEQKTTRKIDLVEKGYLKDFAIESAKDDMVKIYG